jgi:hypothetical protein
MRRSIALSILAILTVGILATMVYSQAITKQLEASDAASINPQAEPTQPTGIVILPVDMTSWVLIPASHGTNHKAVMTNWSYKFDQTSKKKSSRFRLQRNAKLNRNFAGQNTVMRPNRSSWSLTFRH